MRTLTPSEKLSLQVSIALMAGMFSVVPTAYGAPTLNEIKSVTANGAPNNTTVHQSGNMTAVMANGNRNNVIDWTDFSVGANEQVIFDAIDTAGSGYTKTNNYLNTVSGGGTSYINGVMAGGRNVYVVNPNGVIMGKDAVVDVGSLYVSTRDAAAVYKAANVANQSTDMSPLANPATAEADVVNMGRIQADKVSVEAKNIRFLNTADLHYQANTDDGSVQYVENSTTNPASYTTPTTASALAKAIDSKPVMNPAKNLGTVTLNGSGYVHVGYDAYDATNAYLNSDPATDPYSPVTLKYTSNGKTYLTKDNAYALVKNAPQLQDMDTNLTLNYMLGDNITLSGTFKPIGTGEVAADSTHKTGRAFSGSFDGNYFKVSNLTTSGQYAGLFGSVVGSSYSDKAQIMNIGVEGANVEAISTSSKLGYAGGIVGFAKYARIQNVYNKNKTGATYAVKPSYSQSAAASDFGGSLGPYSVSGVVGGVVGYAQESDIDGVYSTGIVYDGAGLVGMMVGSDLTNAYFAGELANTDYTSGGTTPDPHYMITDSVDPAARMSNVSRSSSIKNVYSSGVYTAMKTDYLLSYAYNRALAPTNVTNGYIIDTSKKIGQRLYATSNGAVTGAAMDETKASNYAFMIDASGNRVTKNNDWRVYDGQSVPLLRNFLKANGQGTVPVTFTYNLYNAASGGSKLLNNSVKGSTNKGVVYNGYYIGVDSVQQDSSRNLNTSKIGYDGTKRIKAVGDSNTYFYSTGQDGYDLAADSLEVQKRNLVPDTGTINVSKVYDGTNDFKSAVEDALGVGSNAIDVVAEYNNNGKWVEYGAVKVNTGTSASPVYAYDNVSLGPNAVTQADSGSAYHVSQANPLTVRLSTTGSLTGADAGNYDFDPSGINNGSVQFTGDITRRPVYVGLQEDTGINKTYDSTSGVIYLGSNNNWSSPEDNVQDMSKNVSATDAGLISGDSLVVNAPYYADASGAAVSNAGTGYNVNYELGINSTNANPSYASDYEFLNYVTTGSGTGISYAPGNTVATVNGVQTLSGTGDIATRNVKSTSVQFLDSNNNPITNYDKVYDYTSDFDATGVNFAAGSVTVATAQANGGKTNTEGIIDKDAYAFNFTLGSANYYDATGKNKAKTVSDATQVGFTMTSNASSVLDNYTLDSQPFTINTSVNPNQAEVTIFHKGNITKRAIDVAMLTDSGINKFYDGKDTVKDPSNRGYLAFSNSSTNGTASSGTNTSATGYVGYDANTAYKLVSDDTALNDGTFFVIKAAYSTDGANGTGASASRIAGATANAADVYNPNAQGKGSDKIIDYTVALNGIYADNYTLNGNSATASGTGTAGPQAALTATGAIDPRKITGITFGDVTKNYDGTADVGTVNGVTQDTNQIHVTGLTIDTSDGLTAGTNGLVGNDSFSSVLGTTSQVVGAQTWEVLPSGSGSTLTAKYGTPTSQGGTLVTSQGGTFVANEHAYDLNGDRKGESRQVQYTGVQSITSSNQNYTTAGISNVQYGTGTINPLEINSLSISGTGNISKIYDGTDKVVGGWQPATVSYTGAGSAVPGNLIVTPATQITSAMVEAALGKTATASGLTGKGKDAGGNVISLSNIGYTVDTSNTKYDSTHVGNSTNPGATAINYAVTVSNSAYGDYTLAQQNNAAAVVNNNGDVAGYTSSGGNVAEFSKAATITSRNIFTSPVKNLTKTYDGTDTVFGQNGTNSGSDVVNFDTINANTDGLVGTDGVTNASRAVYAGDTRSGYDANDANVYTDGVQTTQQGAKQVDYTVALSDGNKYSDYTFLKDTDGDGQYSTFTSNTLNMVGQNTYRVDGNDITQADMTVTVAPVEKVYDGNTGVTTATLTQGTGNPAYTPLTGDTVTITTQSSSAYADANVGTGKQVTYDLVATGGGANGKDLSNYRLVDGSGNALSFTQNSNGSYNVTYVGTGDITTLTVGSISAALNQITKVYDGTDTIAYNHALGDFDSTQTGSATAAGYVNNVTLGTLAPLTSGYTVDETNSKYLGTNVGSYNVGSYNVDYVFVIDKSIAQNLDLTALGATYDAAGNATVHYTSTSNNATITPKNVYAYLNSAGLAADPSKQYDGTATVNGITPANLVTVDGLETADPSYTVSAAYQSTDVAVDSSNKPVLSQNDIDYTVGVSGNYNLFTVDANGNIQDKNASAAKNYQYTSTGTSKGNIVDAANPATVIGSGNNMSALVTQPSNVLTGTGTITPKDVYLNTTLAEKDYDGYDTVALSGTATAIPKITVTGTVNNDTLNVAPVSGSYGIYTYDGTTNGFAADPNVNYNAAASTTGYKAVQYKGLALTNGTGKATNYQLAGTAVYSDDLTQAGNTGKYYFDATTGTATYSEAAGLGKIDRKSLSGTGVGSYNAITKVYDGTRDVGYDHTTGGFDTSQSQKATKESFVNGLQIGNTSLVLGQDYTVSSALYNSKDVTTAPQTVDYVYQMSQNFVNNYNLGSISNYNATTNQLTDRITGTITPKNAYVMLTGLAKNANPTKVYDGDAVLRTNSQATADTSKGTAGWTDGGGGTGSATDLHNYLNVDGLKGDTYTVSAVYKDAGGNAAADANAGSKLVAYTANVNDGNGGNNYKLYTTDGNVVSTSTNAMDYAANGSTTALANAGTVNSTLNGTGTIEKNQFTIDFTKAIKEFDNDAVIDMDQLSPTTSASQLPNPTASGTANNETIVLSNTSGQLLTGQYGEYDYQNGGFTADKNVNVTLETDASGNVKYYDSNDNPVTKGTDANGNVIFWDANGNTTDSNGKPIQGYEKIAGTNDKAVQYTGIANALASQTGSANMSNYELVSTAVGNDLTNDTGYLYDSTNNTITFSNKAGKGRIERKQLSANDIEADFKSGYSREYDTTSNVASALSLNNGTGSVVSDLNEAKKYFDIHTTAATGGVSLDYNLTSATFKDTAGNNASDVGNYDMEYVVNGISAVSLRNFVISPTVAQNWQQTFNSNRPASGNVTSSNITGEITKRIISGSAYDSSNNLLGQQLKTYDGTIAGETLTVDHSGRAQANGKTYFDIDDDDMAVLDLNSKTGLVGVTGNYADANANIDPNTTGSGGKAVNYAITDGGLGSNYVIDSAANNQNYNGANYQGKGDIARRPVYVTDSGGIVLEKPYDGTAAATIGTNRTFTLETGSPGTSRGILNDEAELDTVTAEYVKNGTADANVERDSSGTVINKDVKIYLGLKDKNGDADNYYLEADVSGQSNQIAGTTAAGGQTTYITEQDGGRINPQTIRVSVTQAPTKDYDGTDAVTGSYTSAGGTVVNYASVDNITAAGSNVSVANNGAGNLAIDLNNDGTNDENIQLTLQDANYVDTSTTHGTVAAKDVSRSDNTASGTVMQDKEAVYTLGINNGNYDLVDASGRNLTSNASRTAELTAAGAEITPYRLTVTTVNPVTKDYDGTAGVDVASTSTNEVQDVLNGSGTVTGMQAGETMNGILDWDKTYGLYLSNGGTTVNDADANASAGESDTTGISHSMYYQLALNDNDGKNYSFDTGAVKTISGTNAGTGKINRVAITLDADSVSLPYGRALPSPLNGSVGGLRTNGDYTTTPAVLGDTQFKTAGELAAGVQDVTQDKDFTFQSSGSGIYGWYKNQAGTEMRYGTYSYTEVDASKNKTVKSATGWYTDQLDGGTLVHEYDTTNKVWNWYTTKQVTNSYTATAQGGGTVAATVALTDAGGRPLTYLTTTGSYTDTNGNVVARFDQATGTYTDASGNTLFTYDAAKDAYTVGGVSYEWNGNAYKDASGNALALGSVNSTVAQDTAYTDLGASYQPQYGANYYLVQDAGNANALSRYSTGGGGSSGGSSGSSSGGGSVTPKPTSTVTPTPTPTPAVTPTTTPVTETETVTPVVPTVTTDEVVPKSIIPNASAYNQVSHDFNNDVNRNANAAIAYTDTSGNPVEISGKGVESELANTVTTADVDAGAEVQQSDASKSTIAINTSDVVNLLGEDVVSNGSIGLSSGTGTSGTNLTTTEDGYLSVSTDKALTADSQAAIENSDGTTNLSGAADSEAAIENSNGTTNLSNATDSQAAIEGSNGTTNLIGAIGSESEEETAEAVAMNAAGGSSKTRDGQDSELSQDEQDARYKSGEASIEYSAGLSEATDEDEDKDEEEKRRNREQRSEEEEQQDSQAEIQYKNAVA